MSRRTPSPMAGALRPSTPQWKRGCAWRPRVPRSSTWAGAQPVSLQDELQRVLPVIERLRSASAAVISVDTSRPEVIRAAAAAGAGFINDVRALRAPGALQAAAASGCGVCLVHMQGEPPTMQVAPHYA